MTINLDLLDAESATKAIQTAAEIADGNAVEWALGGGLTRVIRKQLTLPRRMM